MTALKHRQVEPCQHAGNIVCNHDDADVIDCTVCGFKHVHPLPDADTLKNFYEKEFYQAEKPTYLDQAGEDYDWKQVEFGLRLSVAQTILGQSTGHVLDIGSGPGDFLATAIENGWSAIGIEPSDYAASHARSRGLDVKTGFFSAVTAEQLDTYDFIHMSEVLEHVPNPRELVLEATKVLKPGGVLCISVPNDFNALQDTVCDQQAKSPWWVVPNHHLNYFDFETLEHLLVSLGLKVEKRLTNFPMELFLLMGHDYTCDPGLGRTVHGWRKKLDIALAKHSSDTLLNFYEGLAATKTGRLVILFASKV